MTDTELPAPNENEPPRALTPLPDADTTTAELTMKQDAQLQTQQSLTPRGASLSVSSDKRDSPRPSLSRAHQLQALSLAPDSNRSNESESLMSYWQALHEQSAPLHDSTSPTSSSPPSEPVNPNPYAYSMSSGRPFAFLAPLNDPMAIPVDAEHSVSYIDDETIAFGGAAMGYGANAGGNGSTIRPEEDALDDLLLFDFVTGDSKQRDEEETGSVINHDHDHDSGSLSGSADDTGSVVGPKSSGLAGSASDPVVNKSSESSNKLRTNAVSAVKKPPVTSHRGSTVQFSSPSVSSSVVRSSSGWTPMKHTRSKSVGRPLVGAHSQDKDSYSSAAQSGRPITPRVLRTQGEDNAMTPRGRHSHTPSMTSLHSISKSPTVPSGPNLLTQERSARRRSMYTSSAAPASNRPESAPFATRYMQSHKRTESQLTREALQMNVGGPENSNVAVFLKMESILKFQDERMRRAKAAVEDAQSVTTVSLEESHKRIAADYNMAHEVRVEEIKKKLEEENEQLRTMLVEYLEAKQSRLQQRKTAMERQQSMAIKEQRRERDRQMKIAQIKKTWYQHLSDKERREVFEENQAQIEERRSRVVDTRMRYLAKKKESGATRHQMVVERRVSIQAERDKRLHSAELKRTGSGRAHTPGSSISSNANSNSLSRPKSAMNLDDTEPPHDGDKT